MRHMVEAILIGALSASSLVLGVFIAFVHRWSPRQIGVVLAFGAGALISAVTFELVEEGVGLAGLRWTAVGLAGGAITYYLLDGMIERRPASGAGAALALGAFLDGIPEQMVLGIGLASGEGVSIGLLVAIFISNLPEAVGSATQMLDGGERRGPILRLWLAVAAICTVASGVGYAIGDTASDELRAVIDGFAAGALLVMLIDSMIPDAYKGCGRPAGLATTLGFAVALALSTLS
jgi:ZIP family zinc transporter